MAILSNLLAVSQPSGVWISIIRAFEGFTNNYILAIVLLTVILRLIWAPIDTVNKKFTQKQTLVQAKMKPELDKLKEKYGNNPQVLNQKQNELYKKYNANTMGSCLFMVIIMALNLVIFFTLFSGLNTMAAYKISSNYENLKYEYANCLDLTKSYLNVNSSEIFKQYDKLYFEVSEKEGKKIISLKQEGLEEILMEKEYVNDYSKGEGESFQSDAVYITALINDLVNPGDSTILIPEVTDEEGNVTTQKVTLSMAIQNVAMRAVEKEYDITQEKFLWIQNIWIADSPFQKSVFDFKSFQGKIGKKNIGENEQFIYNSFMTELNQVKSRVNGYLILPILCILTTYLSMFLSTKKKKGDPNPPQAGGKVMKILMPIIFGVFAVFYNAVFAIYMLVSQLISTLLIPLQNFIVNKWTKHDDNKKQKKVEVVEYSRKF